MTRFGPLLALALASATVGCTIKALASDAGTSDAGSQTVGDQCTAIMTELCEQAASRCGIGLAFTLDQCVSSNVLTCCTGSACGATSPSPQSAVDTCKQAIDLEDCNSMANSVIPDACSGVPQKP
ncbi:MAG TPA: hypothetical protein VN894_00810 [Polyangiaceae bacterium]|nr:hypothetical protein [Polyangiaceae bacterium]